jgi:hypothetical protein
MLKRKRQGEYQSFCSRTSPVWFRPILLLMLLAFHAASLFGQLSLSSALPDATEGSAYSFQVAASGGTGPYHFSLAIASFLPVGLQLGADGTITGTPQTFGSFSFTIQATDSSTPSLTGSRTYSLTVNQKPTTPLSFTTAAILPNATFGAAFNLPLQVSGGRAPYSYFTPIVSLPSGISLNISTGQLLGDTVSASVGTYSFTVTVSDSSVPQQTSQRTFTLSVLPGVQVQAVLHNGARGQAYSDQILAFGGTSPYTFAVTSGSLPPGLVLTPGTGVISGIPTNAGTFNFKITATDVNGLTGSANLSIQIPGTPLTISGAVNGARVGMAFSTSFSIGGGVPPYTMSLASGSMIPPGLKFNPSSGILSGTPTTGGTYGFTINATDSVGDAGTFTFAMPVVDIIPLTLPNGFVGTVYQQFFSTVAFTGQVTISRLSGMFPPGINLGSTGGSTLLQGTPTQNGTFNFTLRATDGLATTDRAYSLIILPSTQTPLTVLQKSLPFGTVGQPYSQAITTTDGTPLFNFSVTLGTVPPGLSLSTAGILSGTPTGAGSYGFDVTVTDATGRSGTGNVNMTIAGPPLTVAPASIPGAAVGQDYSVTFTASGGIPPYHYAMALTTVPGLSLDGSTGVLSGRPTTGGTYIFRIDADGNGSTGSNTYTLNIAGPVMPFFLTPNTLSDGTVGKVYLQTVQATSAGPNVPAQPVQYAVTSGSLPPGMTLDLSAPQFAIFSGVPLTVGAYSFQLTATDANGKTVTVPYTINVVSQPIRVGPDSLPAGINAVPYSVSLTASGGTPPYTFIARDNATTNIFPLGLSLSVNGILSGIPAAGSQQFTVEATDSLGVKGSWYYNLVVNLSTISLSPAQLPGGNIRSPYSVPLSPSGGVGPYTFSVTSGALPSGLTVSSGSLSGTPQQAGLFNFAITAYDSAGGAGSRSYQLVIQGDVITIGPASLPNFVPNQPYSTHLAAAGGTPPYRFTMPSANNWSVGWQVALDGTITGNGPTAATVLDFTVVATDANGSTGAHQYLIQSQSSPSAISLVPASLPPGIAGTAFTAAITATGGNAPYTYSVASGTVPNGITLSSSGVLSGTPSSAGTSSFTIRAQDANGAVGTKLYTLSIGSAPPVCSFSINSSGQVFPSGGGSADVTVTAAVGCAWTVENSLAWVLLTGVSSGTGAGVVTLQVLPNQGTGRMGNIMIAGNVFSLEQQADSANSLGFVASMAQLASAAGWTTSMTLINTSASASNARLSFFDNSGNPLNLPLNFPQTNLGPGWTQASPTPLFAPSLDRTIAPNAQLVMVTADSGTTVPQVGWSQLLSSGGLSGFGIFSDPALKWEAVVPLEARNSSRYILAFDNTGGLATGIAIGNLAQHSATVPIVIRDALGAQIGTAQIDLPALGHISFMLTDNYPVTAAKSGSVEFQTPPGGQISVLGLRSNGPSLTTLPVLADVNNNGGSITHTLFNGGFTNSFTLVNTSSAPAAFTLNFYGENGAGLQVPLHLVQTGEDVTTDSLTRTLPGNGSLTLVTVGQESVPVVAGSAQLSTTGNVSGFGIFNWIQFGQEASVPLETRAASSYVLPFDNTAGLSTGIALANASGTSGTVLVVIRDDTGAPMQNTSIDLVGHGHISFMLTDTYASTAGKRGTIEFVTPAGGRISAMGLRATPSGNLTTIPVM